MELLNKFNELDTKQKVTAIITVLVVLFAIYLAYDTFFGGTSSDSSSPVTPTKAATAALATKAANRNESKSKSNGNSNGELAGAELPPPPQQKEPTPAQLAALAQSQQMQQQYINLVNAYQMAQIEQKLAAADSQIAQSKLSTAKAMVSTQEYAAKLPRNGMNFGDNESAGPQTVYVGQQAGKWLAMLNLNGSYVQVNVGTQLPDGSVVTSISARGVVLDNNGQPSYLPIAKSLQ